MMKATKNTRDEKPSLLAAVALLTDLPEQQLARGQVVDGVDGRAEQGVVCAVFVAFVVGIDNVEIFGGAVGDLGAEVLDEKAAPELFDLAVAGEFFGVCGSNLEAGDCDGVVQGFVGDVCHPSARDDASRCVLQIGY